MGRYYYRSRMQVTTELRTNWERVRENAKIYELILPPKTTIDGIVGKVDQWGTDIENRYGYGTSRTSVTMMQVTQIYKNPKSTILILLCGREHAAILSRENTIDGWTGLRLKITEGAPSDIFDQIRVGSWILFPSRYDCKRDAMDIGFISNETLEDTKKLLEALVDMHKIRQKYDDFHWHDENYIDTYGTVSLTEVLHQEIIFKRALRRLLWDQRKDHWDRKNAVAANLSITTKDGLVTITVKALDGKTYGISLLEKQEELKAHRVYSIYDERFWWDFVYRDKYSGWKTKTPDQQHETLVSRLLEITGCLPSADYSLTYEGKTLAVSHKETASKAILVYLEGKIIKGENLRQKAHDFLILGEPIEEEEVEIPTSQPSQPTKGRSLSLEAQKLIKEGLNGEMQDLEGDFPFHLNIIYKKKKRKWYLEIAGKKFYVKGGQSALAKITSAIKGRAVVDHNKYGWTHGKDTLVIRDRIAELVGEKNALWIVLKVKKMGALMKAMKGLDEQ